MSAGEKRTSDLPVITQMVGSDRIVGIDDPAGVPATSTITYENFFANVSVNAVFTAAFTATVTLGNKSTPQNNESGPQGRLYFDDNYLYVTTSNNVVKRVALSAF